MRRRGGIIELTPLLDVIFVMLFMIIAEFGGRTEAARETARQEIENARTEMEAVKEEYNEKLRDVEARSDNISRMENRINAYEQFDIYAKIVNIKLKNTDGGEREIFISDSFGFEKINYNWDSLTYGENALKAVLKKYSPEENVPVFVVFSYNEKTAYRRDYNMISEIMENFRADGKDVYIKYNAENG